MKVNALIPFRYLFQDMSVACAELVLGNNEPSMDSQGGYDKRNLYMRFVLKSRWWQLKNLSKAV